MNGPEHQIRNALCGNPRWPKKTDAVNGLTQGHAAATVATEDRHQHDNGVDAQPSLV